MGPIEDAGEQTNIAPGILGQMCRFNNDIIEVLALPMYGIITCDNCVPVSAPTIDADPYCPITGEITHFRSGLANIQSCVQQ